MARLNSVSDLGRFRLEIRRRRDPQMAEISVCSDTGCRAWGSNEVISRFEEEIRTQGLEGKARVKTVGCRGFCERGPLVIVGPQGIFYQRVGPDDVAVDSYLQTVGIVKSTPEKQLATWLFLKWFTSPESQAKWIEASAYHPTRASTVPLLNAYATENPVWGTGLDLVPLGQVEPALPSYGTVRRDLQDTFAAIIQGTVDQIPGLLAELDVTAAEAVEEIQ